MGLAATYLNVDQFAVSGDYTPYILENQAVLCDCGVDGDKKRIVVATAFAAGATTVTLKADATRNLTSNLAEIEWSLVEPGEAANIPLHGHTDDDDGGVIVTMPSAHASTHENGGADEIEIENMATADVNTIAWLRPDGAGGVVFTNVGHGDLSGVTAAQHHAKYTDAEARTACVEDDAYGPGWDGDTTHAPSQNAVYDKIEAMGTGISHAIIWALAVKSL